MCGFVDERKLLRSRSSYYLRKIFAISNLTDEENELLTYFYIKNYFRAKICDILHISTTKFTYIENQALLKVKLSLENLFKEHAKS